MVCTELLSCHSSRSDNEGNKEATCHERILFGVGLEPSVPKLGRGVNKLELDFFKCRSLGVGQQGLLIQDRIRTCQKLKLLQIDSICQSYHSEITNSH